MASPTPVVLVTSHEASVGVAVGGTAPGAGADRATALLLEAKGLLQHGQIDEAQFSAVAAATATAEAAEGMARAIAVNTTGATAAAVAAPSPWGAVSITHSHHARNAGDTKHGGGSGGHALRRRDTRAPTMRPTHAPTPVPPTPRPTGAPTVKPTRAPSGAPTEEPTSLPTHLPTRRFVPNQWHNPTAQPTAEPTWDDGGPLRRYLPPNLFDHQDFEPDEEIKTWRNGIRGPGRGGW